MPVGRRAGFVLLNPPAGQVTIADHFSNTLWGRCDAFSNRYGAGCVDTARAGGGGHVGRGGPAGQALTGCGASAALPWRRYAHERSEEPRWPREESKR